MQPPLEQVSDTGETHTVACHYWKDVEAKRKAAGEVTPAALVK
jgi:hypothetical protein